MANVLAWMSKRTAMAIIGAAAVVFLLVVARASTLVSFPLTVALASSWCAWLEEHPEPSDADSSEPRS
jgi:hypothetical protein